MQAEFQQVEMNKSNTRALERDDYLPSPGTFRAAFLELDITPQVSEASPVLLQGIPGPPRRVSKIDDPLKMQLLLIEDDHFTKLLIITADIFGFNVEMVQAIRSYATNWGIEPAGIILNASNTHNAPGTIDQLPQTVGYYYPDYARRIVTLIQKNLHQLYDGLETTKLSWSASEAKIGLNKRQVDGDRIIAGSNPDGPYDRHTTFILAELTESNKQIILVQNSYYNTNFIDKLAISADFPGKLREALHTGGHADGVMFFQGSTGTANQSTIKDGPLNFANSIEDIDYNGNQLAQYIAEKLQTPLHPIEGSICAVLETRQVKFSNPPDCNQLEELVKDENASHLYRDWAYRLLERYPQGNFPTRAPMEIQAVRLGKQVHFLTLPGKPAAELSEATQILFPEYSPLFFLGFTNGLLGYLPTSEMISGGGQECEMFHLLYGWPSPLATGVEPFIEDFVKKLPGLFAPNATKPVYGRHHKFSRRQKAFFILSTGRCGTMTLSHLLNTATNAHVFHHAQPDPIRESLQAYHREIDTIKTFWKFRYGILQQVWSKGMIYGETNHLWTQFSEKIAEEFPDAKFIALVRDPRKYVYSGMRRKYYRGHPWDVGRLRPKEGTPEYEQWDQLDAFEKVCWLWNDTYSRIRGIAKRLGSKRIQFLRLEDLIVNPSVMSVVFKFLGLKGYDLNAIKSVMGKRLNEQTHGDFPPPEDWSQAQISTLWNRCGALAEQFGYKRNDDPHLENNMVKSIEKSAPASDSIVKGRKGRIAKDSVITCPFTIGDFSNIMGKAIIKGKKACRIGRYCAIGWGIHIITSHHDISRANVQIEMQRRHRFRDIWHSHGDVQIGNNVWIGDNAVILSGVTVGDGAVIGAGAIVMDDVPPFGVAAGNPAHVIKMRFSSQIIDQLLEIKWWEWPEERIARNQAFFDLDLAADPSLDLSRVIVS